MEAPPPSPLEENFFRLPYADNSKPVLQCCSQVLMQIKDNKTRELV